MMPEPAAATPPPSLRYAAPLAAGILVVGSAISLLSCWPAVADLAQPVAIVLLLLLAARRLGGWIHRGTLEEDILAGLVMLSLIPVLNQLTGLRLAPTGWWVVILGLAAFGLVGSLSSGDLRRVLSRMEKDGEDSGIFGILFFLPAVAILAWSLLPTLAPPAGMDTLTYHLGLPAQYLARGTLTPPDDLIYYQYTQAGEMLSLLALVADGTGRASTLLLGLSMPLAAIAGGRFAAELAMGSDRRSRATAALARVLGFASIATIPVALFTVAHGKTDALALALVLAGVRRAVVRASCPFRAAFLLGGAVAVKLTAAYVAGPALVYILWRQRSRPAVLASVLLLAALAPSYWLARNVLIFGSLVPQAAHISATVHGAVGPGVAERLLRVMGSTFLMVGHGIDGPMGPVAAALVVFAAAGLFAGRLGPRKASWIAFAALLFWLVTGGGSHAYAQGGLLRFLLPAVGVAVAAGSVLAAECIQPRGGRTPLGSFLGLLLVCALATNMLAAGAVVGRAFPAVDALTRRISASDYLRIWLSTSHVQEAADRILPRDARVLSVGESRLFTLHRDARFDADADLPRVYRALAGSGGDTAVLDAMALREGWTHVLHAANCYAVAIVLGLTPPPTNPGDRARFEGWLAARGRLIVFDPAEQAGLYELIPDSFPARVPPADSSAQQAAIPR